MLKINGGSGKKGEEEMLLLCKKAIIKNACQGMDRKEGAQEKKNKEKSNGEMQHRMMVRKETKYAGLLKKKVKDESRARKISSAIKKREKEAIKET